MRQLNHFKVAVLNNKEKKQLQGKKKKRTEDRKRVSSQEARDSHGFNQSAVNGFKRCLMYSLTNAIKAISSRENVKIEF